MAEEENTTEDWNKNYKVESPSKGSAKGEGYEEKSSSPWSHNMAVDKEEEDRTKTHDLNEVMMFLGFLPFGVTVRPTENSPKSHTILKGQPLDIPRPPLYHARGPGGLVRAATPKEENGNEEFRAKPETKPSCYEDPLVKLGSWLPNAELRQGLESLPHSSKFFRQFPGARLLLARSSQDALLAAVFTAFAEQLLLKSVTSGCLPSGSPQPCTNFIQLLERDCSISFNSTTRPSCKLNAIANSRFRRSCGLYMVDKLKECLPKQLYEQYAANELSTVPGCLKLFPYVSDILGCTIRVYIPTKGTIREWDFSPVRKLHKRKHVCVHVMQKNPQREYILYTAQECQDYNTAITSMNPTLNKPLSQELNTSNTQQLLEYLREHFGDLLALLGTGKQVSNEQLLALIKWVPLAIHHGLSTSEEMLRSVNNLLARLQSSSS